MAHTPGPWAVFHGMVVTANADGSIPPTTQVLGYMNGMRDADARLIAAAPELLAALKAICAADDVKSLADLVTVLPDARAAIAKAEGR